MQLLNFASGFILSSRRRRCNATSVQTLRMKNNHSPERAHYTSDGQRPSERNGQKSERFTYIITRKNALTIERNRE